MTIDARPTATIQFKKTLMNQQIYKEWLIKIKLKY